MRNEYPFEKEYAAATRYACLRNIKFIAELFNNPEKSEKANDFVKRDDIYHPESFIKKNIDYFCSLEDG